LKEAFQIEDYEEHGCISLGGVRDALDQLEITDQDVRQEIEYVLYTRGGGDLA
jgi:Ca2+-binding EF-hand superfamily protein